MLLLLLLLLLLLFCHNEIVPYCPANWVRCSRSVNHTLVYLVYVSPLKINISFNLPIYRSTSAKPGCIEILHLPLYDAFAATAVAVVLSYRKGKNICKFASLQIEFFVVHSKNIVLVSSRFLQFFCLLIWRYAKLSRLISKSPINFMVIAIVTVTASVNRWRISFQAKWSIISI